MRIAKRKRKEKRKQKAAAAAAAAAAGVVEGKEARGDAKVGGLEGGAAAAAAEDEEDEDADVVFDGGFTMPAFVWDR